MKVLIDTCIISDLRRTNGHPKLKEFLESIGEDNCYISVVTLGEIAYGVHGLAEGKRKRELVLWLEQLEKEYLERIVGIDARIAKVWGELNARCKKAGRTLNMADGLIAASAIAGGFHVLTENVKDFDQTGAMVLNPY